ncbi:tRNA pseudouridine(38/39) synthase [Sesamum angolense]|uniref:tRNA pseudouridine(38/39) synthase n=1 Tax=Sesamum angolense TaxID=2727404 RepID=A0AAE1W6Q3_9LAMI|nr:tRNA pseudouridine(38/39) synthase [Sesamum angolense]
MTRRRGDVDDEEGGGKWREKLRGGEDGGRERGSDGEGERERGRDGNGEGQGEREGGGAGEEGDGRWRGGEEGGRGWVVVGLGWGGADRQTLFSLQTIRPVQFPNTWSAPLRQLMKMEENPNTELVESLRIQMESLRRRVHELEAENAKLSVQLGNCVCQKIVESDKNHVLDCSHSTEEMERLKLDENYVKNRSRKKVPGTCNDTIALHHLPKRYIALKVMYFGQRFYGFASEAQMDPTIEETTRSNDYSGETSVEESSGGEIDYVKILNRVLPEDIRIIGWSPAPTDFSASSVKRKGTLASVLIKYRLNMTSIGNNLWEKNYYTRVPIGEIGMFNPSILVPVGPNRAAMVGQYFRFAWTRWCYDIRFLQTRVMSGILLAVSVDTLALRGFSCLSREYKYFFWRKNLNIMLMETAGKKFIGEHDFRNFCKMDAANVHNYMRYITSFEIFRCNERFEDDELWAVKIKGSAFLWHQIRCMVAVLFLIGQGLESPNVIDELLDVERMPRKPQYTMAPEIPLVLQSCVFEGLNFRCSSDARQALHTHFKKECRGYKLKAAIFHEALLSSSCDLYENNQLNSRTKKKESAHILLLSRPTEPSYEERRAKLAAVAGAK